MSKKCKWQKVVYTDNWDDEDWDNNVGFSPGLTKSTDGYEFQLYVPFLRDSIIVHQIPNSDKSGWKKKDFGRWSFFMEGMEENNFSAGKTFESSDKAKAEAIACLRKKFNDAINKLPAQ